MGCFYGCNKNKNISKNKIDLSIFNKESFYF